MDFLTIIILTDIFPGKWYEKETQIPQKETSPDENSGRILCNLLLFASKYSYINIRRILVQLKVSTKKSSI